MGGTRNISSHLPSKDARSGVRAARFPKEVAKDERERPVRRAQSAKSVAVLDEEFHVVEEFDSVWESLGFSSTESASLEARSQLMMSIEKIIRKGDWTQAAAAKRCGVSQPRISDLLRGRIDKFSIDALVDIASALGCRVHFELREAA